MSKYEFLFFKVGRSESTLIVPSTDGTGYYETHLADQEESVCVAWTKTEICPQVFYRYSTSDPFVALM